MTPGVPTKVIAASMGLSAFAVAIIAGLGADNAADHILSKAISSMLVCCALGWVVGVVAERAAMEAIRAYESKNPAQVRAVGAPPAGSSTEALAA